MQVGWDLILEVNVAFEQEVLGSNYFHSLITQAHDFLGFLGRPACQRLGHTLLPNTHPLKLPGKVGPAGDVSRSQGMLTPL